MQLQSARMHIGEPPFWAVAPANGFALLLGVAVAGATAPALIAQNLRNCGKMLKCNNALLLIVLFLGVPHQAATANVCDLGLRHVRIAYTPRCLCKVSQGLIQLSCRGNWPALRVAHIAGTLQFK